MSDKPCTLHGVSRSAAIQRTSDQCLNFMPYLFVTIIVGELNTNAGDEVFLLLTLPGEKAKMPVAGKIIWMTPPGAQGGKVSGIGIQFANELFKSTETTRK